MYLNHQQPSSTMLKYTIASDEGSFSPSHRPDNPDTYNIKDSLETSANPRTRAKMVMKKRAKNVQKRASEYAMLPPINGSHNYRKEIATPYINNATSTHEALETPYTNALGISRLHDVSTPYIMNTHISKMDGMSPLPGREYTLAGKENFTKMGGLAHGGTNIVEVSHMRQGSFAHETITKLQSSSPYIERKSRFDRKPNKYISEKSDLDRNNSKLHIQSNQIGLIDRTERHRSRVIHGNEPFSIRKKIEQFRRWHEEQYKEKLKKLKDEIDNQFEAEQRKMTKSKSNRSKHREENVNKTKPDQKVEEDSEDRGKENKTTTKDSTKTPDDGHASAHAHNDKQQMEVEDVGSGDVVNDNAGSEHTWHTWRDVNESYAYNDVTKYIQDNELMTVEKLDWIKNWIIDVEKALEEPDDDDIL
ncbi:uncharacterized protein LOC110451310 [Mizuhopecten yessoensis]|uniref:Uncharacterized protein n=1 Tax=Mizuhopecten yessoensis TaxID=6573 RepID=A0A210QLY1_MIZYE|nr:uncharacterized protein LOC110451310 [Mizuhopecten yessoensis]OWF49736.1 hypothetical protein KP79_PYT23859 [Mizuhopecten yessoensis]